MIVYDTIWYILYYTYPYFMIVYHDSIVYMIFDSKYDSTITFFDVEYVWYDMWKNTIIIISYHNHDLWFWCWICLMFIWFWMILMILNDVDLYKDNPLLCSWYNGSVLFVFLQSDVQEENSQGFWGSTNQETSLQNFTFLSLGVVDWMEPFLGHLLRLQNEIPLNPQTELFLRQLRLFVNQHVFFAGLNQVWACDDFISVLYFLRCHQRSISQNYLSSFASKKRSNASMSIFPLHPSPC